MSAALTLVREVIWNRRLLGKEVALGVGGNLSIDAFRMALFAA